MEIRLKKFHDMICEVMELRKTYVEDYIKINNIKNIKIVVKPIPDEPFKLDPAVIRLLQNTLNNKEKDRENVINKVSSSYNKYFVIIEELYNKLHVIPPEFTLTFERAGVKSTPIVNVRDIYIHKFFEKLLEEDMNYLNKYIIFKVEDNFYQTPKIIMEESTNTANIAYVQSLDKEICIIKTYIDNKQKVQDKYLIPNFEYV